MGERSTLAADDELTPRESEVLTMLAKGLTTKQLARLLKCAPYTVNDHIKSIYKKLGIDSRAEAGVKAAKMGLV